jgi:hypothetical protein
MKSNVTQYILLITFLFFAFLSGNGFIHPKSVNAQSTNLFSDVFIINGISCPGASDAVAAVATFAGQPPYTFEWSTGDTTFVAEGLAAGFYTITVTESQGMVDVLELFIESPPPIQISITQIGPDALEADATGGNPPYSFVWSTGFQAPLITGLPVGLYEVTVTDANGCTEVATYEILPTGPGWIIFPTNQYHEIVIPAQADLTVNGDPLEPGDIIGVFYDSLGVLACGGYLEWQGVTDTLLAFGDIQITTAVIEGFNLGQEFFWKIYDASSNQTFNANVMYDLTLPNNALYAEFGLSGIELLQGFAVQEISIAEGWSIISTYIEPFDAGLTSVFAPLSQNIIIIKDEKGDVFYPAWNLNTIGPLMIGEGYQIKTVNQGGTKSGFVLIINGVEVDPDTPIVLKPGWNIISFLHRDEYPIETMLASIVSYDPFVQDGEGNHYIPSMGINQIVNMKPGKGYKIKILSNDNVILEYPPPPTKSMTPEKKPAATEHFEGAMNTGNNHIIVIPEKVIPFEAEKGDEVAVLSNGKIVGAAQLFDGYFCFPVFGDDETTKEKDGPVDGDKLHFLYWDQSSQSEIEFEVCQWEEGDDLYENNKLSIAGDIDFENEDDQISISVYPNPGKGKFRLSLEGSESVSGFEISNALGEVLYKYSGEIRSDHVFEFEDYSSGVYFLRVRHFDKTILKKIVVQ